MVFQYPLAQPCFMFVEGHPSMFIRIILIRFKIPCITKCPKSNLVITSPAFKYKLKATFIQ